MQDIEFPENINQDISDCCDKEEPNQLALMRLTYYYLTQIKNKNGDAINPVAHFHLGNGASLFQIHTEANSNQNGLEDSWGVMVNYLYDQESVAKNHEDYSNHNSIAISPKLLKVVQSKKKKTLVY